MNNNLASREISDFLSKHFPQLNQLSSAEFYDWKIFNSPFGRGQIILEIAGGEVAATASLTVKPLIINDQETIGAEIGDTFTHPAHRRKGLFSKMVRGCLDYAKENGMAPIYGTPNRQSLPGYETKLGFPRCESASVKDMFKEIDRKFLIAKIAGKVRNRLLATILGNVYWLVIATRNKIGSFNATRIDWHEISSFPPGLNSRWATSRKDYSFFVGRDTDYLNWRFHSNPNSYRMFLGMINGIARCYFVSKLIKQGDHHIGYLCDYVCWNDDMKMFSAMLGMAEKSLAKDGAMGVELYCGRNSPYFKIARRLGYRLIGDIVVIAAQSSAHGKTLIESKQKWHFTMADADGV
ncbi:GCN5-related N-acetyltransferase [Desulfarculus baarsii DSM 2075]|uniref:GCN5-related N-acetyltransferase n=1 Tax=Desulfarculus baarsii (strain ATCC 33931 / DSM 2075 / LMG 7858 / VKM B-1802 / 2st14) TaxID=644282 RepID=E1QLM3_DESB2|nr:GNAT family N-acetyltransferase [Desulfarculus baarsii]ADK86458.1 GCN5-related N-acetyltransferase [Desulfarculus baarsii DSM 2075]